VRPGTYSRKLRRPHDQSNRRNHHPAEKILMLLPEFGRSTAKPRRPHQINFNLIGSADCDPKLALRAMVIGRHIDGGFDPLRNDTN